MSQIMWYHMTEIARVKVSNRAVWLEVGASKNEQRRKGRAPKSGLFEADLRSRIGCPQATNTGGMPHEKRAPPLT